MKFNLVHTYKMMDPEYCITHIKTILDPLYKKGVITSWVFDYNNKNIIVYTKAASLQALDQKILSDLSLSTGMNISTKIY